MFSSYFLDILTFMKTSFHRIYTKDNIELVGLLYEPDIQTEKVLVHVHGMAGNFYENQFLDFIAQTLTAEGIAFFAFNNRGCEYIKDLSKVENKKRSLIRIGNTYEIFEDCILDIQASIAFVDSKGFSKIHLAGHSLGSPKVAYYVTESNDSRLTSVLFLSPSDMVGLIKVDKDYEKNSALAQKMIEEGKGKELLPYPALWDESLLSAQTYVSLSSIDSNVAIFNLHNPNDKLQVLSKITVPVFVVMGKKDEVLVTSIEDTMSRIQNALTSSPKVETNILGDADHGYTTHGQELADAIKTWIQSM